MSHLEDKEKRQQERVAFLSFWKGDRKACLVMQRSSASCDCDVFLPTFFSRLGLAFRSIAIQISRAIPPSQFKVAILRLTGMKIGRNVYVAPGVIIDPLWPCLIEIADGAILGMGCRILTHEYTATQFRIGAVRIGQRSVIGVGATIRSGVTIGRRSTIGGNSFVTSDVGDDETVGGVPARPVASPAVEGQQA